MAPGGALAVKQMRRIGSDVVMRGGDSSTQLGFTVVEMLVTLILYTITLGLAFSMFSGYQSRTAAQRAAQVFAMDLSLARTSAVRGREVAIVDFDETGGRYFIRLESGDTLVERQFGRDDDIALDSINLQLTGDSVAFDARGVGDLSGSASALGLPVLAHTYQGTLESRLLVQFGSYPVSAQAVDGTGVKALAKRDLVSG